jgi:hypothetical protein
MLSAFEILYVMQSHTITRYTLLLENVSLYFVQQQIQFLRTFFFIFIVCFVPHFLL